MPVYPCDNCGEPADQITHAGYRCTKCGLQWKAQAAIPARTVTISPEAEAATDAAIGKLWAKVMRPTPAQRARIESIIQSVIDEQVKGEQP
jgi:hypothetical protein